MPTLDINRGLSPELISNIIGQYATPEAADTDMFFNAPRARQHIVDQYQRFSGDAFADPFADFSRGNANAVAEAGRAGATIAAGSNMGARVLSFPQQSQQPVATLQPGSGGGGGGPMIGSGGWVDREAQLEQVRNTESARGRIYQLAGEYDPEKRANLLGVGTLYSQIHQRNPNAFSGNPEIDPRFATDKTKKVVGRDALHHIYNDPQFQEELTRNPNKAKALYAAVAGNGRNLETDIESQRQLISEQQTSRKRVIEGIKGIKADPVTGRLTKTVDVKDPLSGEIKQQDVDLTPFDKEIVDKEGGLNRIFGVNLPGYNDGQSSLPRLPNTTEEEHQALLDSTKEIMLKNPGMSKEKAFNVAHKQAWAKQEGIHPSFFGKAKENFMSRTGPMAYDLTSRVLNNAARVPEVLGLMSPGSVPQMETSEDIRNRAIQDYMNSSKRRTQANQVLPW